MVLGCLIDDKFVHKFFLNWARSKASACTQFQEAVGVVDAGRTLLA